MRKVLLLIPLAALPLLLRAASEAPQEPAGFVSVQTILTVEARRDHETNPPEIQRQDVMAWERHDKLRVADLVPFEREQAALELFLLIDDASGSGLGVQLDDLRKFIQSLPASAQVGVGYMRNGTVATTEELTLDHERAAKSLRLPLSSPEVMPSPYLSLSELIRKWPKSTARREVVMVTSGVDPLGGPDLVNPYLDASIRDAQRNGIVVFSIYMPASGHSGHSFFRINVAQGHLAQLAEETGGELFLLGLGAPVSFAPYLDEIRARLDHQYRVTLLYKAEDQARFREVRFATEVPNAELVGPAHVYVAGQKQ